MSLNAHVSMECWYLQKVKYNITDESTRKPERFGVYYTHFGWKSMNQFSPIQLMRGGGRGITTNNCNIADVV